MPSLQDELSRTGLKSTAVKKEYIKTPQIKKTEPLAESLPEKYVEKANEVMSKLTDFYSTLKESDRLTTSKIRNILSMVSEIYNAERIRTEKTLTEQSVEKLQMMRVRILYEAGREEKSVGPFVKEANIIGFLKNIGDDRKEFIKFAHYMEALVAYHRFFNGKDI